MRDLAFLVGGISIQSETVFHAEEVQNDLKNLIMTFVVYARKQNGQE